MLRTALYGNPLARPPSDDGIAVGMAWTVQAALASRIDEMENFIAVLDVDLSLFDRTLQQRGNCISCQQQVEEKWASKF